MTDTGGISTAAVNVSSTPLSPLGIEFQLRLLRLAENLGDPVFHRCKGLGPLGIRERAGGESEAILWETVISCVSDAWRVGDRLIGREPVQILVTALTPRISRCPWSFYWRLPRSRCRRSTSPDSRPGSRRIPSYRPWFDRVLWRRFHFLCPACWWRESSGPCRRARSARWLPQDRRSGGKAAPESRSNPGIPRTVFR